MFSKEELKELKISFWNGFKEFMKKQKSSNGKRVNWLSYKTDVKFIYLRLDVNNKKASINFDIQHKFDDIRAIVYEQMTELKVVLEDSMSTKTIWHEDLNYNNITISRICWEKENVNFYNENDHIEIYEFFKKTLIEFDLFYQDYKDILVALTD